MIRNASMAILGLVGASAGFYAVAAYFISTQTTTCFQGLVVIPATLFGCPIGMAAGILIAHLATRQLMAKP